MSVLGMQETLRMYPAGPSTDRLAHRDMQVGGYFIPKGTIFWISLYTMQNLPSIHDDPAAFKPVSTVTCHCSCNLL
jgi:cytochrome P450